MNETFFYQISDETTLRELYLMIRTLPRRYTFRCDCGIEHTQSSLCMYAECPVCGHGEKLFHFAAGHEVFDVIEWVLRWLGVPETKLHELDLHPDDGGEPVDWSASDRYFGVTLEEIEACRRENVRASDHPTPN